MSSSLNPLDRTVRYLFPGIAGGGAGTTLGLAGAHTAQRWDDPTALRPLVVVIPMVTAGCGFMRDAPNAGAIASLYLSEQVRAREEL